MSQEINTRVIQPLELKLSPNDLFLIEEFNLAEDKSSLSIIDSFGNSLEFNVPDECCNDGWLEDLEDYEPRDFIGTYLTGVELVHVIRNDPDIPPETGRVQESNTMSFYKLHTDKFSATMRWMGTSNGYYAEEVEVRFNKIKVVFDDQEMEK